MHFNRLKITGFKSFVEPTDFVIEAGLTGIVGPNGCGKSNVVESLRWAMGENSARRLRGGEMDDVIFSGSAGRPARNLCEVTLVLDNRARKAMAEFNHDDTLEVTRRIERGMGSDYRINGKPVRQKDVQLLFADHATGAHSTSIVSQGRIAALISAKPQERRQVLEEAAGINGLQTRRHEAELKLKGAETNLTRVDDQVQAMESQLRGLKSQIRQASRYRQVSEQIRKAEASVLFTHSRQAEVQLRLAEDTLAEAEMKVQDLTHAVATATIARTTTAATLPPLRQAETAAAAVVQRLHLERDALERESTRITQEIATLNQRLHETQSDASREQALAQDALEASSRLLGEINRLEAESLQLIQARPGLEQAVAAAGAASAAQEKTVAEHTQRFAEAQAQHSSTNAQASSIAARQAQLNHKSTELRRQQTALEAEMAQLPSLSLASSLIEACETELEGRKQKTEASGQEKTVAEAALIPARETRERAWAEKTKLAAEVAALHKVLRVDAAHGTPLSDRIQVEKGYEAALAAALGDALAAPLATPLEVAAKIFWQDFPVYEAGLAPLPGTTALAQHVQAPPALQRALQGIGLVADEAEGNRLAASLKPGQILVTQQGAAWRWDGYTQRASAITPAAARLQQRNRLAELEGQLQLAEMQAGVAEDQLKQAQNLAQQTARDYQETQHLLQRAFNALNEARRNYAREAEAQAHKTAQMQRLHAMLQTLDADMVQAQAEAEQIAAKQAVLPRLESLSQALLHARNQAAEMRHALSTSQAELAGHQREMKGVQERQRAAKSEQLSWENRAKNTQQRLENLQQRQQQLQAEAAMLAQKPATLAATRETLLSQSSAAETARQEAADRLQQAENLQASQERETRAQEEALAKAKEHRVRAEEQGNQARQHCTLLREKTRADWQCDYTGLLEKIGLTHAEQLKPLAELEQELTRATRERAQMGPVNLRADIEAEALQQQIDTLLADKEDLVQAIAKLRQGIHTLNREARDRLQEAFDAVSGHFSTLFSQLFGGGKAHLQLLEHEDPLAAGLEIFASPPGKRLQALSLLSGGEQALTALALLFALFLVKPSPICVLDEVDAPLDEANVDRYCSLLRQMTTQTNTRFLIITHHRATMARMDRIYGVTMAEKGVSQLVSVDLKQALAMREGSGVQGAVRGIG